ncbi:hypothetical protein FHP29_03490 [Nocardioides albidus]|uniref:Uncharacterized protein n=1 Tax=Nocardioides albidus TaxID=1517589 RepID=A0A5C4WCP6_9ACTN|nr:hypothetical protein FHP29_03490 [Nocardioides albidus]
MSKNAPDACCQLDATEYVLTGDRKCVIFQLIDDHSRYAVVHTGQGRLHGQRPALSPTRPGHHRRHHPGEETHPHRPTRPEPHRAPPARPRSDVRRQRQTPRSTQHVDRSSPMS